MKIKPFYTISRYSGFTNEPIYKLAWKSIPSRIFFSWDLFDYKHDQWDESFRFWGPELILALMINLCAAFLLLWEVPTRSDRTGCVRMFHKNIVWNKHNHFSRLTINQNQTLYSFFNLPLEIGQRTSLHFIRLNLAQDKENKSSHEKSKRKGNF